MSHQDKDRQKVRFNYEYLRLALDWLLRTATFSPLTFRADCTWTAPALASAALLWAWSDEATLVERFVTARRIVQSLLKLQRQPAGSYQAFGKLLRRWTSSFVAVLQAAFRARMLSALAERWLLHGFAVFGSDGSRVELPRTSSNEAAYAPSAARKKRKRRRQGRQSAQARAKKGNSGQLWLTTLWHAATGLPWDWRLGPADSSERRHLLEMLDSLPEHALIAADAGFVGYEFLSRIHASGRHFLVRVGANVRLLRKLGYARESQSRVYLWPDQAAQKSRSPLTLRLVIAGGGKHPVYLITNVLSPNRLTDRQVGDLYRLRWGIELFYRHLKQTYQRRKLRSAKAENARLELEWSLLGLWAIALYAQVELARKQIAANKVSIAGALRAFRRMLRDYLHPADSANSLCALVRRAVIDDYRRTNKASRTDTRRKYESPPGPPDIRPANHTQIQNARQLAAKAKKG
jgi:Transposase DDE domain